MVEVGLLKVHHTQ